MLAALPIIIDAYLPWFIIAGLLALFTTVIES